jgi:hypothetical protein
MKLKMLGLAVGAALLALQSTAASADTDVWIGLDIGVPAPVVVERRPVYYHEYEPAPVYYYEYREYPRTYVYEERYEPRHVHRHHDRGRHRGHYKHR